MHAPPGSRLSGPPVQIETRGYLLRSLVASDVTERFLAWINSPEMHAGLNLHGVSFTHAQLVQFVSSFDNLSHYLIGIFEPKQRLLIGFYTLDINHLHKVGNITTGIGETAHAGKGVLWATIDALLDHFFLYRDVFKITARVLSNNRRMIFNFVGNPRFAFEACLHKECLGAEGQRIDLLVFSAFRHHEDMPKAERLPS